MRLLHLLEQEALITNDLPHYLEKEDLNQVIYHCKTEDILARLEKIFREAEKVRDFMTEDGWHGISPSGLQNTSAPDATYRSKAGKNHKGYTGNLVETVGEDGDSLITGVG